MYKKSDLEKDISQIWLMYTGAYEYFICLKQLKDYKKNDFSDSRFIFFITYTSWYILVIELCKIYQHKNKSQHYNLYSIFEKLKLGYETLDFKDLLSKSDIEKFESVFNSPQIKSISDRLGVLRDKFYAHTDRFNEEFVNKISVSLSELDILFSLLRNFISEIKGKVFLAHTEFDEEIYVKISDILKILEKTNENHHKEIIRRFNEEKSKL